MNPRAASLSILLHFGSIIMLAVVAAVDEVAAPPRPATLHFLPAEPAVAGGAHAAPTMLPIAEPMEEPELPAFRAEPQPFDVPAEPSWRPSPAPAVAELIPADPGRRLKRSEPTPQLTGVPGPTPAEPVAPPAVRAEETTSFVEAHSLIAQNERPEYPREAIRRGWSGTVRLRLSIDASGAVTAVELLSSSRHGLLDRAAIRAARTWRFAPARLDGAAVASVKDLPVEFRLLDG